MYPEATTRFHPTFLYEIIANLLIAGLLIWLGRKFQDKLKPWTIFYIWLSAEGVKRFFIEYFRPDQPRIPGTDFSYSRLAAVLMAVIGALLLLVRYEKISLPLLTPWTQQI